MPLAGRQHRPRESVSGARPEDVAAWLRWFVSPHPPILSLIAWSVKLSVSVLLKLCARALADVSPLCAARQIGTGFVALPRHTDQSAAGCILWVLERTGSAASATIVRDKHGTQPLHTNFKFHPPERRVTTSSVTPAVPPPEQGCMLELSPSRGHPELSKTSTATANVSPRTVLQRAPAALHN
ncbi:hypothetical protein DFH09DRAFT_1341856 [Mycena vulgaris]|nr:hypothetical protein DFH09DRAFT_1341856 [Mycena vulgaris]